MCRPRELLAWEEQAIGQAVIVARAKGIAWKVLMRRYGLGRTGLYYLARAERERQAGNDKDVREHLGAGQGQGSEVRRQGSFDKLRMRGAI